MQQTLNKDDEKIKEVNQGVKQTSKSITTTGLALAVWAGVITIAILAVGVLVFRRMRKSRDVARKWSGAESVVSDAESGTSQGGSMSDTSSVVDLSTTGSPSVGRKNQGYEEDAHGDEYTSPCNLNDQEELDFENVRGIYEDDGKNAEDSYDPNPANARAAFGQVVPKGTLRGKRNLFLPDQGASFM